MSHAIQTTPSIGWVVEKMGDLPAKQVTPLGAWLLLRRPFVSALQCAEAELCSDVVSAAAYDAASAAVKAARQALREFDRSNQKPHAAKVWAQVGRNDPLLQVIFGGKA